MQTLDDVQTWRGKTMVHQDGDKIGKIEDVFLDRHTGAPEWATVKTGLFGLKSSFVPIRDAEIVGDDEVRVPFQKEQVKDAPKMDADGEPLDRRGAAAVGALSAAPTTANGRVRTARWTWGGPTRLRAARPRGRRGSPACACVARSWLAVAPGARRPDEPSDRS